MDIDFSGLTFSSSRRERPTDPNKIFESLTLRGTVKNIWNPQSSAIERWHADRHRPDIAIEMSTGDGKTLVGLLVGQSVVNEHRRPALYVCPTIQLAEQTRALAEESGFETATYLNRRWRDQEVYDDARGVCITTYAAVFNRYARLSRQEPKPHTIIFDDAHVAGDEVRSQFTLRIPPDHAAFKQAIDLLRPAFSNPFDEMKLRALLARYPQDLLFLPQFEMRRIAGPLGALLVKHGVDQPDTGTAYAWGYIGGRLPICSLLIGRSGIEIAPPILPMSGVWCMGADVRRVYLTATLPSTSEFTRVFGLSDLHLVTPGGKSGTAQRLFVLAPGDDDAHQRASARMLIKDHKAAVIVPSKAATKAWQGHGTVFESTDGHEEIRRFKASTQPEKLVLAARYHGIDFPGDTCRVLVLDGLPRGDALLDRFFDEGLQAESLRASLTATRLIQAVGRIFRGNTDHGAVILVGGELQRWFRSPALRSLLPVLMQAQVQLGIDLRTNVNQGTLSFDTVLRGVLTGAKAWDDMYNRQIGSYDPEALAATSAWLSGFAMREHEAYVALWNGNAAGAASAYAALAEDAMKEDKTLAAWYLHWAGTAYEEAGQRERAVESYVNAANLRTALGRPRLDGSDWIDSRSAPNVSAQAEAIAAIWEREHTKVGTRLRDAASKLATGIDHKLSEPALMELGRLLGFESTRPDTPAEGKTGPDVLWRVAGGKGGLAVDAKTDKELTSQYRKKDDIGQFHDHVQWLSTRHPEEQFRHMIVGPILPVSNESNPPEDLWIVAPEAFAELSGRVERLYEMLTVGGRESREILAERWIRALGLRWPGVVTALPGRKAVDLQSAETDTEP